MNGHSAGPAGGRADTCQYCGAGVVFRRTVRSQGRKWMPVDPAPSMIGTLALDGHGWVYVRGREDTLTLFPDDDPVPDLYRPHFETCPNYPGREEHRRRLKPRRDTGDGLEDED